MRELSAMRYGAGLDAPILRPLALPEGRRRALGTTGRALVSELVLGSALYSMIIAGMGVPLLFGPPPGATTTGAELTVTTPGAADPDPATGAPLLFPLGIAGSALAGLILLWAGARGLADCRDRRRWLARQVPSVLGAAAAVLAYGAGLLYGDHVTRASYARSMYQGLELVPRCVLPILLVATAGLLIRAARKDDADGLR